MDEKILLVDDEQNLLNGYKRILGSDFQIDLALGPEEGLAMLNSGNSYMVIVADMRMPGMNGIDFLVQAKIISPQSIRMMLTGNSDVETAIEAVNFGNVFRYLTKPCPSEKLKEALTEGIIEYKSRFVELEAASIDSLTGLYNRRRLEEKIKEDNELRKRYGSAKSEYSVMFIDLDNFKYYNDTYGHPVGDLLLKEFSGLIKRIIRTADFAARYGGDEFLILLPETSIDGAEILAGRIKEEIVKENQFQHKIESLIGSFSMPDMDKKLSCSIGIADATSGTDLLTILKHADDSVLEAKRSGKNCFIVWDKNKA